MPVIPSRDGGRMGAILNVVNREGNGKVTGSANISLISKALWKVLSQNGKA